MAHPTVETVIETYLRANWTRCAIRVENTGNQPPANGDEFLTLQFPFSDTQRWPISNRVYRETGGFRLVLAAKSGMGMATIRLWGGELRDLFIDRKIDGVDCRVPSAPFIDGDYDEGPYILAAIVVPYFFNFTA